MSGERIAEIAGQVLELCQSLDVPVHEMTGSRFRENGFSYSNGQWRAIMAEAIALDGREATEEAMASATPVGFYTKSTSTYGKDRLGRPVWTRAFVDQQKRHEALLQAIRDLPSRIDPREGCIPAPTTPASADMLAIYPMGDPHIGMMSWEQETGENWDLKKAEAVFGRAMDDLAQRGTRTERAWLLNLGDFYHSDDATNRTKRSGHLLDIDGRRAKVIDAGIRVMRRAIDACLRNHQHVRVTCLIGNHDDESSVWLSRCLYGYYANEPRVEIDQSPDQYRFYRFGQNLFGAHHGHESPPQKLPQIMATHHESKPHWSDAGYCEWFVGHWHKLVMQEVGGCTIGHYRTLAARDAYAASKGYSSHRDLNRLVYHESGNLWDLDRITAERVIHDLQAEAA